MPPFQTKAPGKGHPQAELHQLPRRPERQRPIQHDIMTIQRAKEQQLLPQEPDGGDAAQHRHPHFRRGRGHGTRADPGTGQNTGSAGGTRHDRRVHVARRARERGDLRGQHGDVKGANSSVETEKREELINFSELSEFYCLQCAILHLNWHRQDLTPDNARSVGEIKF